MLKKTTIYLEESDIDRLKVLSLLTKSSMTDLIRKGIEAYYTTLDADQKAALKSVYQRKKVVIQREKLKRGNELWKKLSTVF